MIKNLFLLALVAAIIVVIAISVNKTRQNNSNTTAGIKVAASFYPLAEFSKQVGGEKVEVINIVPSGAEPHNFEPSPQIIAKIYLADIFIFNGGNFDPWAEKISLELEKKGIVVIDMAQHFNLLENVDKTEDEKSERSDHKENLDPHIWLDPVLAQKEVEIIRDTLKKIDPGNGSIYDKNTEQYLTKLTELDKKYKDGLSSCEIRDAVASHAAFGYLAKRYDLNVVSISGFSPDEEPSSKKIAEIAKFARKKDIKYIFFETLVSPKLAETIASEIGAKTLVFNPIEGLSEEELAHGKNYISIMEENLTDLRQALICR